MIDQMLKTLEGILDQVEPVLGKVDASNLSNPTPCKDYDVKGVVNHIVGGLHYFSAIAAGGTAAEGDAPDFSADPVGSFRQGKEALLKTLSDPENLKGTWKFPFGEMSVVEGLGIALTEAVVHGWDLNKGLGLDAEIDPTLAGMLLAGAQQIPAAMRNEAGNPFALPVEVPADASPTDKLVAQLGRKP